MFGIIGGTGLTQLKNLTLVRRQLVRTPYGDASQPLIFGKLSGYEVVFLARHGGGHTIPPHAINYRANIWALKSVGVQSLLAIATVGGIAEQFKTGDIVLPNQMLDYTYARHNTYHDGVALPVHHIDFTEPYTDSLRQLCKAAAVNSNIPIHDEGVYACVQGPRLETAAEINRYEKDGASMIGMTGMPEAALARELALDYAALCPVANAAAGRGDSKKGIQYESMQTQLDSTMQNVCTLIKAIVNAYYQSASYLNDS